MVVADWGRGLSITSGRGVVVLACGVPLVIVSRRLPLTWALRRQTR